MRSLVLFIFIGLPFFGLARQKPIDSLYRQLNHAQNDSVRYYYLHRIYSYYEEIQKDSALVVAKKMYAIAKENKQYYTSITCMGMIGYQQMGLGNYSESLNILLKALSLSEDKTKKVNNSWSVESGTIGTGYPKHIEQEIVEAHINHILGNLLFNTGNIEQAELYFRRALEIGLATNYNNWIGYQL